MSDPVKQDLLGAIGDARGKLTFGVIPDFSYSFLYITRLSVRNALTTFSILATTSPIELLESLMFIAPKVFLTNYAAQNLPVQPLSS